MRRTLMPALPSGLRHALTPDRVIMWKRPPFAIQLPFGIIVAFGKEWR